MSKDIIIIDAKGKAQAWASYLKKAGKEGVIVPTGGQVYSFPDRLFPIGISFDREKIDFGRVINKDKEDAISKGIAEAGVEGRVFIATDKDVEGDAIALDIMNIIAEISSRPNNPSPGILNRTFRVHAKSLVLADISEAVETAIPVKNNLQRIMEAAVEGRTRAVTDRWIGAALSKKAGIPIGRVKSAVPGMALLHQARPESLTGPVEVGEVVLTARSGAGGIPFNTRISFNSDGKDDKRDILIGIAKKFSNRIIPGTVRPVVSLSAAVTDKWSDLKPYNTGDAVRDACRYYGVRPHQAMQGIVRAYYRGDVSYPRTESRTLTPQSAAKIARLGVSCDIFGLSASDAVEMDRTERVHEALHPVCESNIKNVKRLRSMVRRDWVTVFRERDQNTEPELELMADLMTALIARRAFEVAKSARMERGFWRPSNDHSGPSLTHDEMDVLENLDWERETGPVFPWTRHMTTGVRIWPRESVLMDMMMKEDLGRHSSLPAMLKSVIEAGDVDVDDRSVTADTGFVLPKLTQQGRDNLKKMPKSIWDPATGRMIARALSNADGESNEDEKDSIDLRIRKRVALWLGKLDEEVRNVMLAEMS